MHVWRSEPDPSLLVAFSEGARGPDGEAFPTAFLARRFAASVGAGELPLAWARQVHGATVLEVDGGIAPGNSACAGEGDILIAARPRVALAVQTADCVPILLAAPGAVAAVHAGWRGTAKNAAAMAARALRDRFGTSVESIRAVIGPAIGACCYEVGGDVAAAFAGAFVRKECGGKYRVDLKAANRAQLEAEGVPSENITTLPHCTMCGGERFASYRREGPGAGRMIALVARL